MARLTRLPRDWQHVLRQFRGPLLTAPLLGLVLGAAAGMLLWANELETGSGPSFTYLVGFGGAIGAGLSVVAALGAAAALTIAPRGRDGATEQTLLLRIAVGAAAAVTLSVLAVGAGSAIATGSWEWFGITCWTAIVTGTISGVSATATTAIFRYRPGGWL